MSQFEIYQKVQNNVKLYLVVYPVQFIESHCFGVFYFYFFESLSGPNRKSQILKNETLTKNTVRTLLNEPFSLDQNKNRNKLKHINEGNIKFDLEKKDLFYWLKLCKI